MGKVLHASGSGYFPSCIEESADSKYAIWPLEKAMQSYWRVRAWNFTAKVTVIPFGESPFELSYSVANIFSTANQESDLVCFNEFNDPSRGVDIFFFPATNGNYLYKKVGDLYYSGLAGFIVDGSTSLEFVFGPDIFDQFGNEFSFPVLGADLKIGSFYFLDSQPEDYNPVADCEASLTPSEWWSYGGTYDTSTGASL
jgi:hypothetical protein